MSRIYLDHAATSFPKPPQVYAAVNMALREWGVAAGRGTTREAVEINRMLSQTRQRLAELLNATDPCGVVFTQNGTAALNQALHGWLRPGDHVICTAADHNSVLRPLAWMAEQTGVSVTCLPCSRSGWVDPDDFSRHWHSNTRLVTISHASNVTGVVQDAAAIGKLAQARNTVFLLDAAQTLGCVPIDVHGWGVDLLAAPGHKGLFGPLGTGILYASPRCQAELRPLLQGGTGTVSESEQQPADWPERMESGNLNVPGIAGLLAGVNWVLETGVARIHADQQQRRRDFVDLLRSAIGERVSLFGCQSLSESVGIVSLNATDWEPQDLAVVLDQQSPRVQIRAGLHCAPRMHATLGTISRGGTARFSWGPLNTWEELSLTGHLLQRLLTS
ncbi:MAG: aminotransferase class V-fold PLP-dependent enzyme [Pirellulales bacterium]|nr:aminotransferase class V-fold PLP-dependent enzyme [Pirellulales bacterium]